MKIVKIELKNEHETRFTSLKSYFGVSQDTEVIRLAIKLAYESIFGKAQLNKDSEIKNKIDELFYQGYFEEFLEELEEKDPVLFKNYIESRKVKPSEKSVEACT